MAMTEILTLPYLLPSQAQKHVTHNEALKALDVIVQLSVLGRNSTVPPTLPAAGDRYIVSVGATGAWANYENHIAAWQDGAWVFYSPRAGWLAYVLDEQVLLVSDGATWRLAVADPSPPERLGLNTTAEDPNRLALAGAASLFTHEGAGHQLKVNKAASPDTASVLFQRGFSGRAELGLLGDDNFHVKVSADGAVFVEALQIDRNSGRVTFPAGVAGLREQLTADRTFYVAPMGSDLDDGLSAASAFATLQAAVDATHKLDCSIYDVTIQLADGAYAGAEVLRPLLGGGTLFIRGNETTPSAVELGSGITVGSGAQVHVSGIKFEIATDWISAFSVENGAHLRIGRLEFGSVGINADHINTQSPCQITLEADYTVSGGARRHMGIGRATVVGINRTIALINSPAFSEFLFVRDCAVVSLWDPLIMGTATGRRFHADTNGVINLFGKTTDFLPGDTVGTTRNGGIYA